MTTINIASMGATDTGQKISSHSFVTLHYRLSGPEHDFVNTFTGNAATMSLGAGTLSPTVEACLFGLSEGDHKTFELEAGVAFGLHNPEMRQWVTSGMLRELGEVKTHYQLGEIVQFPTPDGTGTFAGVVVELADGLSESVPVDAEFLVDFNHPLAGLPVVLEVQIIAVL
jgi:FKBP-type peptidyl-prolyl cis-trans isomerase SlpA